MADGDLCELSPVILVAGDCVLADVVSGPGAGQRWHVRDALVDAWEPVGLTLFAGQGTIGALRSWVDAGPDPLEGLQLGVDQWGRLVCDIRYPGDTSNWSIVWQQQGRGTLGTITRSGSTATVTWPERRVGPYIGGPLAVELTSP